MTVGRRFPFGGESLYPANERVVDRYAKLFHDFFCHMSWNVGIADASIHEFLEPEWMPVIRWLPRPAKGTYLADPFGIAHDGRVFAFCEGFDYNRNKGIILYFEISPDGTVSPPKVAMELAFHLAYPFVFEADGRIYCIPETHEAREVGLYAAERFPDRWKKVSTLIPEFAGVDSTIFAHGGRWWIFCTNRDMGPNRALFGFHSRALTGPWEPHALNPLKRGRVGTRPAGTPFVHKGDLYRPSMDSSRTYGRRIIIHKVRNLTPTEFEEEPARVIEPFRSGGYADGIHTISAAGPITLVDGMRVTFERTEFSRTLDRERRRLLARFNPMWHRA